MAVCDLIRNFMIGKNNDLTQIHIAHYHHGQRSQSDDELVLIQHYCEIHQITFHTDYYQ